MYSVACRYVKYPPSRTVTSRPRITPDLSWQSILWWAQVTLTPEESKTTVLRRGTEKVSRATMPTGGQQQPSSTAGLRELWKKAQKKAPKKQTSDKMKRIMPDRKPVMTLGVWDPM